MKHQCAWCGSEISPEDGRVPVGAISDGICAPCASRHFRARAGMAPSWHRFEIDGYQIDAKIAPRRNPPHVGADSPRFLEPAHPARLLDLRVFANSRDVTAELAPAELAEIELRVSEVSGITQGPAATLFLARGRPHSRQRALPFGGHLQRAMERTGYGRRD